MQSYSFNFNSPPFSALSLAYSIDSSRNNFTFLRFSSILSTWSSKFPNFSGYFFTIAIISFIYSRLRSFCNWVAIIVAISFCSSFRLLITAEYAISYMLTVTLARKKRKISYIKNKKMDCLYSIVHSIV